MFCVLGNTLGLEGNIERVKIQYTTFRNHILYPDMTRRGIYGQIFPFARGSSQGQSPWELQEGKGHLWSYIPSWVLKHDKCKLFHKQILSIQSFTRKRINCTKTKLLTKHLIGKYYVIVIHHFPLSSFVPHGIQIKLLRTLFTWLFPMNSHHMQKIL